MTMVDLLLLARPKIVSKLCYRSGNAKPTFEADPHYPALCLPDLSFIWRRGRDSNSRSTKWTPVFKTGGFNRSPTPPIRILASYNLACLAENPCCNHVAKCRTLLQCRRRQMDVMLVHLNSTVPGRQHRCFRWVSLSRRSGFRAVA
jgi:hypothetical protein